MTGDAGILLFIEFDNVIGLSRAIEETVHINDDISHRKHENVDVFMQKIYLNAAGYHADEHADNLRHDPAFTTILNKSEHASQPTVSRLNLHLDTDTMKEFQEVNGTLIDRYYELDAPELYKLCEELSLGIDYVIRLKSNQRLQRIAAAFGDNNASEVDIHEDHHVYYREFTYKAGSWDKSRKVMLKLEKPEDQLFFIPTLIVTTLGDTPKDTVQFYAKRGTMENYIKEGKFGFAFGKMSSTEFEINANKLQIAVLAYNLNNGLRRICMPEKMKKHQTQTIRMCLIKIAGKIIQSGRYVIFKLASSSLYKDAFFSTLRRIHQLPVFS